jgi:hypothetical protein
MSKRVVCLLSILLLIGLSAPVASADPDSAALARTAPVVQPAIYTPTAAKPALVKPSVVKPRIPAPKASFGFRVGGMQAKPRIVLPRDGAPTTDRSTFQGFGGAFAKPACRVELTRPAPSLQGAAKTLAKCTSGCCSDGVTYFDEADEVVVSERFVPVGQEDGPPPTPPTRSTTASAARRTATTAAHATRAPPAMTPLAATAAAAIRVPAAPAVR